MIPKFIEKIILFCLERARHVMTPFTTEFIYAKK